MSEKGVSIRRHAQSRRESRGQFGRDPLRARDRGGKSDWCVELALIARTASSSLSLRLPPHTRRVHAMRRRTDADEPRDRVGAGQCSLPSPRHCAALL